MEGDEHRPHVKSVPSLNAVLVQIFVLDIVFSLDSVITALGMVKVMPIQIISVVLAALMMLVGITRLAKFVDKHPTIKMLALSFLVLIGVNLVAEGLGFDIPRGYTYFAMAWSVVVEMLNLHFFRKRRQLREKVVKQGHPEAMPATTDREWLETQSHIHDHQVSANVDPTVKAKKGNRKSQGKPR